MIKMKRLFSAILFIALSLFSFAQTSKMVVITGRISGKYVPAEIALNSVANGEAVLHSKAKIAADGTFGFCFTPEYNGFYTVGDKNKSVRVYVKPGKQINFEITDKGYTYLNTNDKENKCLETWAMELQKLKDFNKLGSPVTYIEAFPQFPEFEKKKDQILAKTKSGNATFDRLFKEMVQAEFESEIYHFLYMPRTTHPKVTDYPEIYSRIPQTRQFNTSSILKLDFGMQFLNFYLMFQMSNLNKEGQPRISPADVLLSKVANDTLKGWYLLRNNLTRAKAYDQVYRDQVEKYNKYIITAEQKRTLNDFILTIRSMGVGEAAVNFDGNTVDGKKVSLSDYKGKVVYVDVWATWCGPCKKEIPALQKLEEEMKGTDVVFISYSVDELKDAAKWKKMVETEKLGGVQLMGDAAFKSTICVDYKINAIPRFLLFDKAGKIVSIDASRPSNPETKEIITKLL
jgi:thiol-disulfide isomerase/thioredoxin